MIDFNEDKQNRKIADLHKAEEEELTKQMASNYDLPYIDLSITPINTDSLRFISEIESRENQIGVFNHIDKNVEVAIISPKNTQSIQSIQKIIDRGYKVKIFMASHSSLEKVWNRYKDLSYSFETKSGALDISNEEISDFLKEVHSMEDVAKLIKDVLEMKKTYRISKILEIILAGAINMNCSDIHIEPEESYVRIRYRLDGVLVDILNFDPETFKLLLSRIKLISNLKLNISGAQDGRFSIKINEAEIEIRTSLLPGAYGDSVVMRVLNPNSISIPLEDLYIDKKMLDVILKQIQKPNGMILNTGPTGSGKTTTLYAFLKKIHAPGIKIITIENPVEYHLPGIVQTQTDEKSGYTFASGLRSALRQDPDIIMVGEIRDSETAEIAINSALTGHLVFSTLHTNSSAGTFPRLIDLGINPKVLGSAINVAMAQRLVRKLCDNCKEKVNIDQKNLNEVKNVLDNITDKSYLENIQTEYLFKAKGCEKCNNTGYKGRIGIYEMVVMDESIENIVKESSSEREIEEVSKKQGFLNMKEDGILKVLKGLTTIEELERIITIEN